MCSPSTATPPGVFIWSALLAMKLSFTPRAVEVCASDRAGGFVRSVDVGIVDGQSLRFGRACDEGRVHGRAVEACPPDKAVFSVGPVDVFPIDSHPIDLCTRCPDEDLGDTRAVEACPPDRAAVG